MRVINVFRDSIILLCLGLLLLLFGCVKSATTKKVVRADKANKYAVMANEVHV